MTMEKIAEEARQNLAKKDQEIAKSVQDKAMEAAKAVGDAKGLSVVKVPVHFWLVYNPHRMD